MNEVRLLLRLVFGLVILLEQLCDGLLLGGESVLVGGLVLVPYMSQI